MNQTPSVWREWFEFGRRILFVVAALAGIVALFYAEENWRGERKWSRYRAELEAKGELIDWEKLVPQRPSDAENVMSVPDMDRWFVKGRTNSEQGFLKTAPPRTGPSTTFQLATVGLAPNPPPLTPDDFYRRVAPKRIRTGANVLLFTPPGEIPEIVLDRSITNLSEWLRVSKADPLLAAPVSIETLSANRFAVIAHRGDWFTAQDYLDWSAQFEPQLGTVREALKRPMVYLEGDYSVGFQMPIPNFVHSRVFAQFVAARADAFILLKRPAEALDELKLIENFCRVLRSRPTTLVSAMIDVAIQGLVLKTIEEGFAEGVWTDAECREIQNLFKDVNLIEVAVNGFRMERPGIVNLVENGALAGELKVFRWMPRGWSELNLVNYLELSEAGLEWTDVTNRLLRPAKAAAAQETVLSRLSSKSPLMILAQVGIPNVEKATRNAAKNQDLVHQTLTAAALERFRNENGKYPQTLDELAPKYIETVPHDVVNGGPMRYEKRAEGYVLYSIGWDLKDDLKPILADSRLSLEAIFSNLAVEQDWVWRGVPMRADFE